MKAVQYATYGGPEVLQIVDVEEPHAGPGEIRIAVKAAGVNPIDWKLRSGMLSQGKPLEHPSGVGLDAAGVVDEIGDGVEGFAVGDEVFGSTPGGAVAEYAVLTDWVRKPVAMSFEEAAGLPVPTETARRAFNILGLHGGQTLLVNGASGGVGLAAVQMARASGARVIAVASEPNHAFLRSLGTEPTTYGEGLVERIKALAPDGIDLAFDVAGSGVIPELLELTGAPERVVTIADYNAGQYGVRVTGGGDESAPEGRREAAELFEQGRFTIPVAQTFPMTETGEAHARSQVGHVLGKYIVTVP